MKEPRTSTPLGTEEWGSPLTGRFLELGAAAANLEARPWLRRALIECLPEIRRILTAPMR